MIVRHEWEGKWVSCVMNKIPASGSNLSTGKGKIPAVLVLILRSQRRRRLFGAEPPDGLQGGPPGWKESRLNKLTL
jgi:hypothetical protein